MATPTIFLGFYGAMDLICADATFLLEYLKLDYYVRVWVLYIGSTRIRTLTFFFRLEGSY